MARNWVLLTVVGFILGGGALFAGWWYYNRYFLSPSDVPKWKTQGIRSRLPFWSRQNQQEYELVNRHET